MLSGRLRNLFFHGGKIPVAKADEAQRHDSNEADQSNGVVSVLIQRSELPV